MSFTRAFALLVLWLSTGGLALAQVTPAAGQQEFDTLKTALNSTVLGVSDTATHTDIAPKDGKLVWDDFGVWKPAAWRLKNSGGLETFLTGLDSSYPTLKARNVTGQVASYLEPLRGRIQGDWFSASDGNEKAAYDILRKQYTDAMNCITQNAAAFAAAQPAAPVTATTGAVTNVPVPGGPTATGQGAPTGTGAGQGAPAPVTVAAAGAPLTVLGVSSTPTGAVAANGSGAPSPAGIGQGGPPIDPGKGGGYLPPFQSPIQQPPFQGPAQFPQPWSPNQPNPAWQGANTISISMDPRTGGLVINGNPQLIAAILGMLNQFAAGGGNGVGPINMGLPPGPGGTGVFPPQYPPQQYPPQQYPPQQYPPQQYPYPQQPVAGLPQQPGGVFNPGQPQIPGLPQQPGGVFNPGQPQIPGLPQQPGPVFNPGQPQIPGLPQGPVAGLPQGPLTGFPGQIPGKIPGTFPGQIPGQIPLPPVPGKGIQVGVNPGGGITVTLGGPGANYPYPGQTYPGQTYPGQVQTPLVGGIDAQGNLYRADGQPAGVRAINGGNGQLTLVDQNGYSVGRIILQQGQNGQTIGTMVSNSGQVLGQVVYGANGTAQIYDTRQQQGGYYPQGQVTSYPPQGGYYPPVQFPGQVGLPPSPGKGGVVLNGPGQFPGQIPGQFPGQIAGQFPGQIPGQFPGQFPGIPPTPGKGGVVIVQQPPVPPYQGGPYDYPGWPGTPPFIPSQKGGGVYYPQPYPQPYPYPPQNGKKISGTEIAITSILGAGIGAIGDRQNPGKGAILGGVIFGAADLLLQATRKNPNPPPPYTYINPNIPDKGPLVMQGGNYNVYQSGAMYDQYGQQVMNVNQEGLLMGPQGDFLAKLK